MFVEVVLIEERRRAERLSDALVEAGALSASLEDADAGGIDEVPLYGEPGLDPEAHGWTRSRVTALFDGSSDVDGALRVACGEAGLGAMPPTERCAVEDADWVRRTQAQFAPIAIGRRLWIVPSWHAKPDAAEAADAIVLRLDPGLAFGTGDHPTTRLCLAWLDEAMPCGASVIDYGCGSGILAIAAKKLGAATVAGTDVDPQAVTAAIANARDNAVEGRFTVVSGFASPPADVVVANILANPLRTLAPVLGNLVAPHGTLVLSGILERQWEDVAAAYAPTIRLAVWRRDDGWVCLVGRR